MDDYIRREDAIAALMQYTWYDDEGQTINDYDEKKDIISEMLCDVCPADVRENVRGEWIERKDIYPHKPDGEITSWTYKCSRCNQLSQLKYDFCFNCGADMRGEKDDGKTGD